MADWQGDKGRRSRGEGRSKQVDGDRAVEGMNLRTGREELVGGYGVGGSAQERNAWRGRDLHAGRGRSEQEVGGESRRRR
jgi:hypothetical protein